MKKKFCIITAALLALSISLTGCNRKLDGTQAVAVMDETSIPLAEVNLLLRYQQAQMETYYGGMMGNNIYQQDLGGDGIIYGETVKTSLMETFQELYILEAEAAEYGVSLSEEEKSAITEAATKFMESNPDEKVRAALTASQQTVERLLTLLTLEDKMKEALWADVDTNVSDQEAAQKKATYLYVSKSGTETDADGNAIPLTGEELEALKEKAQGILDEAKKSKDLSGAAQAQEMTTSTVTYDDDTAMFPDEVRAEADKLSEGEYTGLVETDKAFYSVQMDSMMDRNATDAKKESIVQERKDAMFAEKYEALKGNHTFEIRDSVLAQMTFEQTITLKIEE